MTFFDTVTHCHQGLLNFFFKPFVLQKCIGCDDWGLLEPVYPATFRGGLDFLLIIDAVWPLGWPALCMAVELRLYSPIHFDTYRV